MTVEDDLRKTQEPVDVLLKILGELKCVVNKPKLTDCFHIIQKKKNTELIYIEKNNNGIYYSPDLENDLKTLGKMKLVKKISSRFYIITEMGKKEAENLSLENEFADFPNLIKNQYIHTSHHKQKHL